MPGRGALGRNKGPLGQGLGEERLWGQGLHAPHGPARQELQRL